MKWFHSRLIAIVASLPIAAGAQQSTILVPIESGAPIAAVNVTTQSVTYRRKAALRVEPRAGGGGPHPIAVLPHEFSFGTIELDVSGAPAPGADTTVARGFVGIAFRVQTDTQRRASGRRCGSSSSRMGPSCT